MLESYTIDDDVAQAGERAIEVTLKLADGRRGWCFFATPAGLANFGDLVEGTQVRVHLGVPHMIVVSELSQDVIERVLRELDASDELLDHILELP